MLPKQSEASQTTPIETWQEYFKKNRSRLQRDSMAHRAFFTVFNEWRLDDIDFIMREFPEIAKVRMNGQTAMHMLVSGPQFQPRGFEHPKPDQVAFDYRILLAIRELHRLNPLLITTRDKQGRTPLTLCQELLWRSDKDRSMRNRIIDTLNSLPGVTRKPKTTEVGSEVIVKSPTTRRKSKTTKAHSRSASKSTSAYSESSTPNFFVPHAWFL